MSRNKNMFNIKYQKKNNTKLVLFLNASFIIDIITK